MADMSVNIKTPQLDGIIERLDPGARAELHREIAEEIQQTVQKHLRGYARSHHKTARDLGADLTGNLEDAAASGVEAFSDSDGATVTVAAKGIRRALGPLEIRPRNKAALTIPVAAIAYGRKVSYLESQGINVFRPKGKDYLAYKENPKSQFSTVIYILARRATLKHEPDLLPRKEELAANALEAARDYIMEGNAA